MARILLILFLLLSVCSSDRGLDWTAYSLSEIRSGLFQLPAHLNRSDGLSCDKYLLRRLPCNVVIYSGDCQPGYEDGAECRDNYRVPLLIECPRYECKSAGAKPDMMPATRSTLPTATAATSASHDSGLGETILSTVSSSKSDLTLPTGNYYTCSIERIC